MLWWGESKPDKKPKLSLCKPPLRSLCSVPSSNASRGDPHVQFALGSVLKLTRSAFGGLGSFRTPSIRRALPVLLGGLLCAVGSGAMARIESVSFVSTPQGGPGAGGTVYIIGETVQIAVDYSDAVAPLSNVGSPKLGIRIGAADPTNKNNRDADCAIDDNNNRRLLCSYVVKEGDVASDSDGITVRAEDISGGVLPARQFTAPTAHAREVDGVRLAVTGITTGGNADGFKANDSIALVLTFGAAGEVVSNAGTFGATLVLDNAERAARFVRITNSRELNFTYTVVDGDNARAFGLKLTGGDALKDENGNVGLAEETGVEAQLAGLVAGHRRVDTRGPQMTQILLRGVGAAVVARDGEVTAPTSTPVKDGVVVFDVFFDEPVTATGMTLRVTVGDTTVPTETCVGGTNSEWVRCNLTISPGWLDTDGLSTPANPLNFATIRDALDNDAAPAFAAQRFPELKVDSESPTVTSARITVPRVEIGSNVVVSVTFSEDIKVTGTSAQAPISIDEDRNVSAVFASATRNVVEFRYRLTEDDLMRRTSDKTSSRIKLKIPIVVTGITDIASNVANGDVTETAAHKTGTTFSLKTVPSDSTRAAVYADSTAPTLDRIALGGTVKEVYGIGDRIAFDILFSEPVTLTEGPGAGDTAEAVSLSLRIGSDTLIHEITPADSGVRKAATVTALAEGSYTGSVSVSGIVLRDDDDRIFDSSTITVSNRSSSAPVALECEDGRERLDSNNVGTGTYDHRCLGRGWIYDPDGDEAALSGRTETSLIGKGLTGRATVDTKRPKVESVKLLTNPGPGAVGNDRQRYYGRDEIIRLEVTMDEDVSITGTTKPVLEMSVGDQTPDADFKLLRGKRTLIFEYKVDGSVCDAQNPVHGANCHIARSGISVTQFKDDHSSIVDAAGNTCSNATSSGTCGFTWPSAVSSSHGVDASLSGDQKVTPITEEDPALPQTVNPVGTPVVRSSTPTGGYYKDGDTITIEVPLSPPVTFTSAPQLLLNFNEGGSQRLTANERISSNGTPTPRLTFSYQVRSGDEDLDGFTGTLSGGGTLSVESGQQVNLGSITVSGIRIDALEPELESLEITSSAGADGTYVAGDNIVVTATFSEDVERQGVTDPSVPILVGDSTKTARLSPSSTAGGDTWVFRYTVVAGDSDADGVSIAANALEGELEDAAGNEATITHAAVAASTAHTVDTQGPRVTGVAVTGAGTDNLFVEGDTITATVTFDEEVDVATSGSNAVRVRFYIGTSLRSATYAGGDDTTTLTFTYEVVAGDSGFVSLPANALQGQAEDDAGNAAGSTPAVPVTRYRVDASAPMLVGAPSISSSPASGDTYVEGETITVQVSFDEPVIVTGEPRLPIMVGDRLRSVVRYTSGGGSDTLTFSYTVVKGDMDDDGISIAANALRLVSGATIRDVNGLAAGIAHGALADQPGHKVDAVAPGIESLAITSSPASGDAYLIDETIEVTVTFSESITTSGSPMLALMVGTGSRDAACAQGGARTELMCSYTVAANDFDADGVSVNADSLSGTITDMPGNAATLTHDALADDPDHKVYAAAPEAVGTITTLSLAAGGATNSLDLDDIFTGFQLTYSATSDNTNVAVATVSGSELTVASGMEGTATVTVTATNLAGSASTTFGVIVATDPVETAVLNDALAAIGRSMLSSTANVIGSRFELAATSSQTMALGGSTFGGSLSPEMQRFLAGNDPFALQDRMSERALFSGSGGAQQAYGGSYGLTADRLFTGTSFNMPLNALGTGDMQFAVWGAGDLQSFEGEPDNGMYDGSSSSGYIGVDARGDGWLAGVSVSRSGAEADYDFDGIVQGETGGTLETSVTAFHPYARLEVGPDSEIWVIGGFGGGEADLSRTHVMGSQSGDLSMAMAVGGLRRALAIEFGGAGLSLRGDAGFLSLETDSGMMAIDGLSASVSRLRLGVEAAWDIESMTPFVEVSGRFDGGDGQTGGGLELAGGIRILNAESGFGLEAKGRVLAMHTGEGYSESGIGVTASFEPGAAGRGITFRLSPRWGGSADSTDLFWDEVGNVRDASQYAYGMGRTQTWGVDAALGYGFGLRSMPGIVTPFGQMDVTGAQDQRLRIGVRYGLMQGLLGGTQVELSAERVDGEMYPVGETRVLMSGRARF